MTVVVIGGDAAGMSAASRIARKAKDFHVIVFEKTDIVSYGACGLPYYIGGINDDIELVKIRTPDEFRAGGVDLRLWHEVTAVDFEGRTVTVKDLQTGETFVQPYDKLILASGSRPILPPVEGRDLKNVFVLKTIPQAEEIKRVILRDSVRTVAVIGGGFIGLEVCEALLNRGRKPLLFEALDHIMNGYDELFQTALEKHISEKGVELHLAESVEKIEGENGSVQRIRTAKGIYDVDAVIFAVGVRPNTELYVDSRLRKFPNGAIITNDAMETGIPDVYAAGDCATLHNAVTGKQDYIALGTNANKQGRLTADAILGKEVHFNRTLGTTILRVMGFEMGKTGVSDREAAANGMDTKSVTVQNISHSPYFTAPPPYVLTARLTYDRKSHIIRGAQIMGEKEAAMRINIFACALDRKMTTEELGMLDLAYSPSVTYVWDIVNIVANAAK
jgi:NADPH-dependent 2,4-dienoyl-CoA reductase/sulfur reductase-like enzyme